MAYFSDDVLKADEISRWPETSKRILIPAGITLGVTLIVIGLLIHKLAIPFNTYIIGKLFSYIVARIVDVTGINQSFVRGIVIIDLMPLIWVIPNLYRGKYKKSARIIGILYFSFFFLVLSSLSRDLNSAQPIDPANAQFINPITGEAQVWFYKDFNGNYEFFGKPGYHPITGATLQAATKNVYFEWKKEQKGKDKKPETTTTQALIKREKEIPSQVMWVDTGITLINGEYFQIEASGQWSRGSASPQFVGPDGFNVYKPGVILPSAKLASLIGKVGNYTFSVGRSFAGNSPASGKLFLSINDSPDAFKDNSAAIITRIFTKE